MATVEYGYRRSGKDVLTAGSGENDPNDWGKNLANEGRRKTQSRSPEAGSEYLGGDFQ